MIRFYTSASKCGSACQNLKFTPSLHIIKCKKLVIFHRYSSYSYVTRGNAIIDGKGLLLVTCYFFPIRTGPVHRACTENVNSFSVCLFLPIGLLQTVIYFQSNKPYLQGSYPKFGDTNCQLIFSQISFTHRVVTQRLGIRTVSSFLVKLVLPIGWV